MPPPSAAAKLDLDRAVKAYLAAQSALASFQMACQQGDEEGAEQARFEYLGCQEAFLDNFAAAHRI